MQRMVLVVLVEADEITNLEEVVEFANSMVGQGIGGIGTRYNPGGELTWFKLTDSAFKGAIDSMDRAKRGDTRPRFGITKENG